MKTENKLEEQEALNKKLYEIHAVSTFHEAYVVAEAISKAASAAADAGATLHETAAAAIDVIITANAGDTVNAVDAFHNAFVLAKVIADAASAAGDYEAAHEAVTAALDELYSPPKK